MSVIFGGRRRLRGGTRVVSSGLRSRIEQDVSASRSQHASARAAIVCFMAALCIAGSKIPGAAACTMVGPNFLLLLSEADKDPEVVCVKRPTLERILRDIQVRDPNREASAAVKAGDYRLLVNNWSFACDNPLDYGSEQIACDRGALRRQEMRFRVFVRAAHGWPPEPDTADQREPADYEFEGDPDAPCVRSIRVAAHRFVVRFNLQLVSAAPQALRPACKLTTSTNGSTVHWPH